MQRTSTKFLSSTVQNGTKNNNATTNLFNQVSAIYTADLQAFIK